jgi:hypothetical protein
MVSTPLVPRFLFPERIAVKSIAREIIHTVEPVIVLIVG